MAQAMPPRWDKYRQAYIRSICSCTAPGGRFIVSQRFRDRGKKAREAEEGSNEVDSSSK